MQSFESRTRRSAADNISKQSLRPNIGRSVGVLPAVALLTLLCAGWLAPRATADDDHVVARKLRDAGAILPLEQIIQRARAVKPGELIETELGRKHGRYVYEVEILDQGGQVWEIKLDARTGELIKLERDD